MTFAPPSTRSLRALRVVVLGWTAALACGATRADDGFAPITPYRPSVSSPAALPAAGQLELELGGLRGRSGEATRRSVPYLLKLAFDADWGVLLGGEARVWQQDAGGSAHGAGDTSVTLKRAWHVDDATVFGTEFAVKLPTAADPIGTGGTDLSINTIYSRDLGSLHLDANLNALRLDRPDAGSGRVQVGASAALSTPIASGWGLTGELSGTRRAGVGSQVQVLAALTWSPSKLLTIDAGVARAPRPSPATTQVFFGAVLPLAKLF